MEHLQVVYSDSLSAVHTTGELIRGVKVDSEDAQIEKQNSRFREPNSANVMRVVSILSTNSVLVNAVKVHVTVLQTQDFISASIVRILSLNISFSL